MIGFVNPNFLLGCVRVGSSLITCNLWLDEVDDKLESMVDIVFEDDREGIDMCEEERECASALMNSLICPAVGELNKILELFLSLIHI